MPVPGTNTTGAFSICDALAGDHRQPVGAAARPVRHADRSAAVHRLRPACQLDLSGNELPQAPNWKFSAGIQYTLRPRQRHDARAPGRLHLHRQLFWARSFNRPIDQVDGYEVINAQIQLNGQDDRWFVRAFVQNLTGNDAITGHYVTDQSSGLFTNVFTLEPRRYGVAAGVRF